MGFVIVPMSLSGTRTKTCNKDNTNYKYNESFKWVVHIVGVLIVIQIYGKLSNLLFFYLKLLTYLCGMNLIKTIILNLIGLLLIAVTGMFLGVTLMYFGYLKVGGKGIINR